MEKLDQRIQLVASVEFNNVVDRWRREQADLPSRSEAIRRLVLHGLEYEKSFPMRMITAIIRPHKYEELRDALVAIGIEGITVTQVQGFGRQRGHSEIYRGAEYQVMEVPKVRIDVAVSAELVEKAVRAIERAASIRLRPILMTTAAMVLGVLPLITATGAGAAARYSIGLVIATGMSIGTIFTLFVVPMFYTYVSPAKHRASHESMETVPAE